MGAGLLQFDSPLCFNVDELNSDFLLYNDNGDDQELQEEEDIILAAFKDPYKDQESYKEQGSYQDQSDESNESTADASRRDSILDILIPPSEYTEDGMLYIQRVSRVPPSRTAVIQLWEQLDIKLKERQARSSGICSIRRGLYQEAFDELIRQVTLDCPERGLLLARVRDEAAMTIAAFQSLFHSASEFGSTKAIQTESGKSELEDDVQGLEERVFALEAENRSLEAWRRQVSRRARERREVQMSLFTEELECLQRSEQQYQILIETLLASKSS